MIATAPQALSNADERRVLLDPQRFYWALLDASVVPPRASRLTGRRRLHQQLGFIFENVLPIDIEQVHAVYANAPPIVPPKLTTSTPFNASSNTSPNTPTTSSDQGEKRYVACGMARDELTAIIAQQANEPIAVSPTSLPSFIAQQIDSSSELASSLNLLTKDFEPPLVRGARHRWSTHLGLMLAICLGLIAGGLQRRVGDLNRRLEQVQLARVTIYKDAMGYPQSQRGLTPTSTAGGGSSVGGPESGIGGVVAAGAELRMIAELRTLRQTRQQQPGLNDGSSPHGDATDSLAALLAHWPDDLFIQADSILIAPTSMTIRGYLPSSGDVQTLADAVKGIKGWKLTQPQINATSNGVQATLQLKAISALESMGTGTEPTRGEMGEPS